MNSRYNENVSQVLMTMNDIKKNVMRESLLKNLKSKDLEILENLEKPQI